MLREVALADVDRHWPRVLQGLNEILERYPQDWVPADVYVALKNARAVLFLLGDVTDHGFTVLQLLHDFGRPHLFVWVLYGKNEIGRELEGPILQALKGKAIALGAQSIRMRSPRKGWERRGWKIKEFTYEAELWQADQAALPTA